MLLSTPRLHSFSVTLETSTPGLTGSNIIEIIFKHDRHLISCLFCVWIIGGTVLTPAHIDNQKKTSSGRGDTSLTYRSTRHRDMSYGGPGYPRTHSRAQNTVHICSLHVLHVAKCATSVALQIHHV